jgi:SAM-dependent methyltransferase
MLWILPLALYLATFIIVFANWDHKHQRRVQLFSASLVLPALGFLLLKPAIPAIALLLLYITIFASLTLTFHGKLALEKPAPEHLTLFFLCMSIGGAIGGLFNGLFAPLFFNDFLEFFVALWIAGAALSTSFNAQDPRARAMQAATVALVFIISINLTVNKDLAPDFFIATGLMAFLAAVLFDRAPRVVWALTLTALLALWINRLDSKEVVHRERSFFSTHQIRDNSQLKLRYIAHGTTIHGTQSLDPKLKGSALLYYHARGPAGQALRTRSADKHYAMLGLGAGALAAYCRGGITCDFFEIDPVVVKLARQQFTYLSDCGAPCAVEIGDGRLLLAAKPPQTYDIIFLDAYSSDSVPAHLLTREALQIYRDRLKPNGLLLFHLSNRYLDLRPVLATLAHDSNMKAAIMRYLPNDEDKDLLAGASVWAAMSTEDTAIQPLLSAGWSPLIMKPGEPLWTDSFSNLIPIISVDGLDTPR